MSKTPTETQPAERRAYRVNEFCQAYRVSRDTRLQAHAERQAQVFLRWNRTPHFGRGRPGAGEGVVIRHGPSQTARASMTRDNNKSRKRKAPARTGAEKKDGMYAYDTRQRSRAQ